MSFFCRHSLLQWFVFDQPPLCCLWDQTRIVMVVGWGCNTDDARLWNGGLINPLPKKKVRPFQLTWSCPLFLSLLPTTKKSFNRIKQLVSQQRPKTIKKFAGLLQFVPLNQDKNLQLCQCNKPYDNSAFFKNALNHDCFCIIGQYFLMCSYVLMALF